MKGRKPKAPELHKLHGNPSKLPRAQLKTKTTGERVERSTPPPPDLGEEAAQLWRETVAVVPREVLKRADVATLSSYCQVWAMMRSAARKWNETGDLWLPDGNGGYKSAPWYRTYRELAPVLRGIAETLGLTPVGRTRLAIAQYQAARAGALVPKDDDGDKPEVKTANVRPARKRGAAKPPPPLGAFLASAPTADRPN